MKNIDIEKIVRLSDADWLKLRDFSKAITAKLKTKLPGDWYLSDDDIQGTVYGTFVKLLSEYKPGAMSPVSYCWRYAEVRAMDALMREYRRLKQGVPLDDLENPPEDEYEERHEYGEYEIEPYKPLDEHLDESDLVDQVQKIADENGLGKIAKLLKTMTEREIADELCQSVSAIHKKIEKLRRLCAKLK